MPKRPKPKRKPTSTETRAIDLLTHAWMLSVVTGLVCEVIPSLATLYVIFIDRNAGTLLLFRDFMLFSATVIGIISLVMLPLVLWKRRVPPPRLVVIVAVLVGAAPLVIAVWRGYQ